MSVRIFLKVRGNSREAWFEEYPEQKSWGLRKGEALGGLIRDMSDVFTRATGLVVELGRSPGSGSVAAKLSGHTDMIGAGSDVPHAIGNLLLQNFDKMAELGVEIVFLPRTEMTEFLRLKEKGRTPGD